jgi:uncharacterized protein YcfJ
MDSSSLPSSDRPDFRPPGSTSPNASSTPKALWAVIGGLVVAVAALGGVLLHQRSDSPPPPALASASSNLPLQGPDDFKAGDAPAPLAPQAAVNVPAPAPVAPQAAWRAPGRAPAPAPVVAAAPAPRPAPRPICATCGRVESVHTVQRAAAPTGVGAVAGGVLGGVLGNQVGGGSGRVAATVLGAVGGGYVGNTVEKRTRTVTAYEVHVRMDDGSLRTFETASAPPIGKAVTVDGKVLRPADGRA